MNEATNAGAAAELSDAQIKAMTDSALASTNDTGSMSLLRYWYSKGVRDGAALTSAPADDDLSKLHDLLYTAQRFEGEMRDEAIGKARLLVHNMRKTASAEHDRYTTVYNAWALLKAERVDEAFAVLSKLVGHTPPQTPQAAGAIDAREQCPKCGAPCATTVNMRGGDYGWGTTDAERTVYRYAPSPPAAGAAQAVADMYLQLAEAMGYTSGKDGMEFSPEEWAAALLKDATAYRALAATPAPEVGKYPQMPSPRFKPTKGLLAGTELFTIKEMYAAYDLGRASLKAAHPGERKDEAA